MPIKDLHVLPKVKDSQSFVYAEHCKIDQDDKSIAFHDLEGKTQVPCANLMTLFAGPGTSITHAAIRTLAENGCLVYWTGEMGVRFYALSRKCSTLHANRRIPTKRRYFDEY